MKYHKACSECVMNNDGCLLQDHGDVESCEDVREAELDEE